MLLMMIALQEEEADKQEPTSRAGRCDFLLSSCEYDSGLYKNQFKCIHFLSTVFRELVTQGVEGA